MNGININTEMEQKIDQLVKILDDGIVKKINTGLNGLSFWVGTQQEYDSIATKSETTIYLIKK